MKTNKKKLLSVIMGLWLSLCMAGCGSSSSDATIDLPEEEAAEETTVDGTNEEAAEETTVDASKEDTVEETWKLAVESKVDFPIFAVDFYDASHGVTVGTAGKVFYTGDGGQNWTKAANDSACRFGVEIINDNIVYTCGNQSEVTKSTNGGADFEKVTEYGESEPNQCTLMSFCDENTGIAASKDKLGLTTDGAATWTDLTVPCKIQAIRIASADEIYLISDDMNLYWTKDGAKTWDNTKIELPLKDDYYLDLNNLVFSVDGDQAFTIYCIQNSEKLLRSYSTTDNCATFTENKMPDTKMPVVPRLATVKLSNLGNMLTIYNFGNSTIYSYEKIEN